MDEADVGGRGGSSQGEELAEGRDCCVEGDCERDGWRALAFLLGSAGFLRGFA